MNQTDNPIFEINPKLDLVLERTVDIAKELIWQAWTEPKHLPHWFAPAPWSVADCEIDLRPGGIFKTVMRSPEGELFPSSGCYLDVRPNEQLIWTDALGPGYRPNKETFFTAVLTLADAGNGTIYRVLAKHGSEEQCKAHNDMGFLDGWGTCLDQMLAYMKDKA